MKASNVGMLNVGLVDLADEMRGEPGYLEGDPLMCPTTRLEIVPGGGCTNRHFWHCDCGKRVAAVYKLPNANGVWSVASTQCPRISRLTTRVSAVPEYAVFAHDRDVGV